MTPTHKSDHEFGTKIWLYSSNIKNVSAYLLLLSFEFEMAYWEGGGRGEGGRETRVVRSICPASVFCGLLVCVCAYFPFDYVGGMDVGFDLLHVLPDYCLSFYFIQF